MASAAKKINYALVFRICVVLFIAIFMWFFPSIVIYIFAAFILALMGKPLAKVISKIKISKKRTIPYGISSFIAILLILSLFISFLLLLIPLLGNEFANLKNIDYEAISAYLSDVLNNLQRFLYEYNIMKPDQTIVGIVTNEIKDILNVGIFSNLLGNVIGGVITTTGTFIMALFSIFFMGFFFIKDDIRFDTLIRPFVSKKYTSRVSLISEKVNDLLTRYCIGSFVRILIMTVLLYIGLLLFGIKGAGIMAFIGGILNIIPYIGPIIGAVICVFIGFLNCVGGGMYTDILPVVLEIVGIFIVANVVDNILLQPIIFSQSLKIHAVEVFLVTIIGGEVGGILGMILAVPVYTIIRVMVIEIYNFVNNATILLRKKPEI